MPTASVRDYNIARLEPALFPEDARTLSVKLGASQTLTKGTVLGQVTVGGAYIAYATAAVDGSGVAKAILPYDAVTDASGNITLGNVTPGEFGDEITNVEVFISGTFAVADLTGWDADALADLQAREIHSVAGAVLVRIP